MKFGFVTCVQLGLSCIEKIYEIGGKLDVLITIPDNKAKAKSGRVYLDEISQRHQIPLFKINHINDKECIDVIKKYDLDWLFIIGWSQIASANVLTSPKEGCIGMHPTLLPVGRGRAAIPWAIIKGLDKTGVSMFVMDEGVDTGALLGQIEIPLTIKSTATELYEEVDKAHVDLIADVFPKLKLNKIVPVAQDGAKATYWDGRKPEDGEILESMTINEVDRLVRATTHPYPGAFFVKENKKVIVWEALFVEESTGEFSFQLLDGFLIPQKFSALKL